MLPSQHPDRIQITFDDPRLVANAGLLLPVTLAQHLGLDELVERHIDLGDAPGRANPADKLLTLVASALAGGDCIDDDVLRTGGTGRALGCVVMAPSTLGTFPRSFRWGHVRQLDPVSRKLLARAWSAGAGPGDGPLTVYLDSIRRRRTRPTEWSRRMLAIMDTTASGAITRCWPSPPVQVKCSWHGCAGVGPTPLAAQHTSCVRPWRECVTQGPQDNSPSAPTAAATLTT